MLNFADKTGGVKLNSTLYSTSHVCPAWAKGWDRDDWSDRGVVVWDEGTQRLQRLWASEALKLLGALRADEAWKTAGIPIMRQSTWLPLDEKPRGKHTRKKRGETQPLPETPKREPKIVVEERFRLTPCASVELYEFLSAHELTLKDIAEEDERETARKLANVYEMLLKAGREAKLRDFDLSARPLPWRRDAEELQLVCELPPNRGTVSSDAFYLRWRGCIERPDEFKTWGPFFKELSDAIAWVEQEIVKPPPKDEDDEMPVLELTSDLLERLQPYWIPPEALEPSQMTFRVLIELEYQAVSFKTGEMSFGNTYQYDKKFLDARSLGKELLLSPERLEIEHLEYTGLYRVWSLVTYHDERLALTNLSNSGTKAPFLSTTNPARSSMLPMAWKRSKQIISE